MSHDDFAFDAAPGIPAPLPPGERLLWQGTPEWRSLAVRAYHVRKAAVYFLVLVLWRVTVGIIHSQPAREVLGSCGLLIGLGAIATGVLALLAYCASRSAIYTITSRRLLLRHGIAVPMTMNLPLSLVEEASVKLFHNGTGDIAVAVPKEHRVGYLINWPHLRPRLVTRPQPSFRALRDVKRAADILSAALAADAKLQTGQSASAASSARGMGTQPIVVPITAARGGTRTAAA